jgi:GntR family transcriptional regulator
MEPGQEVVEVVRLRLSDERPLALERSLFPSARFPGLLDQSLDGSLYALLAEAYADAPVRAVEMLEPVVADAREAEILGVRAGAPLLLIERTAFDAKDVAVEWARDLFRGDRTRVVVSSNVGPAAAAEQYVANDG